MNRRSFMKGAALTAGAAIPFQSLLARVSADSSAAVRRGHTAGYGPLFEVEDMATGLPLLMLPRGFSYISFGWTGDPMVNGLPTPGSHDGMAAFPAGPQRVRLVRNHERGAGTPFSAAAYNPLAAGGTTTLEFDLAAGQPISTVDSLSGTIRNCAGGPTPWGTWLTCEETNDLRTLPHGYVFEVPADGTHGSGIPIKDMGRFSHEAVAVDPATGNVYETEDSGSSSGFYRFVPHQPGNLAAGGTLWMLKVADVFQANLGAGYANGTTFDVEWVPIASPDYAGAPQSEFVFQQGRVQGAAQLSRLEGCWYAGGIVYVVSTSGGAAGQGQVWAYDPAEETISLLIESPSADVLNAPDNITVSPRGGLVLCEDGSGAEFMHGLTVDGEIFPFARNNVRLNGEKNGFVGDFTGSEWAGACFSPDGRWLFANLQSPGITVAIRGPWKSGAL
ncbi:MAG: alkaline phosphatase PhoX [Vicinamibacterales bacterium]